MRLSELRRRWATRPQSSARQCRESKSSCFSTFLLAAVDFLPPLRRDEVAATWKWLNSNHGAPAPKSAFARTMDYEENRRLLMKHGKNRCRPGVRNFVAAGKVFVN